MESMIMSDPCEAGTRAFAPITVQIEITDLCNMRCPMCITSEHRHMRRNAVITPEFIRTKILGPLRKRGLQWLSISGGEPTLSTHLIQVIEDARSLGFGVFLATNALTEQINPFEKILHAIAGAPSAIQVSFDSLHRDEMKQIRGGNYFDKVRRNIIKLRELIGGQNNLLRLLASVVIQEQNAYSFLETVDYTVSKLNFDNTIVQLRHDYRNVNSSNWRKQIPLTLTSAAREAILDNGAALFERAKTDKRIIVIGENLKNWIALLRNPSEIDIPCRAARRVFVDPYGNLRGCIHSEIIGNLNEITVDEYFESEPYQKFLSFSRTCNICIHGCSR